MLRSRTVTARLLTILASGLATFAGLSVARTAPVPVDIHEWTVPWVDTRPYGIALDPVTLALKEYARPEGARGRRIAITSDDKVWYVDYGRGKLARLDPASGKVDEWAAPSGDQSLPYAMAGDDRDRLWFVETRPQPNRLVGFDPKTSTYFANTPIAGGAGTVGHMVFARAGRELWFGTDKNTIGRARIP
jgi:virginiamycin B lyase